MNFRQSSIRSDNYQRARTAKISTIGRVVVAYYVQINCPKVIPSTNDYVCFYELNQMTLTAKISARSVLLCSKLSCTIVKVT